MRCIWGGIWKWLGRGRNKRGCLIIDIVEQWMEESRILRLCSEDFLKNYTTRLHCGVQEQYEQ